MSLSITQNYKQLLEVADTVVDSHTKLQHTLERLVKIREGIEGVMREERPRKEFRDDLVLEEVDIMERVWVAIDESNFQDAVQSLKLMDKSSDVYSKAKKLVVLKIFAVLKNENGVMELVKLLELLDCILKKEERQKHVISLFLSMQLAKMALTCKDALIFKNSDSMFLVESILQIIKSYCKTMSLQRLLSVRITNFEEASFWADDLDVSSSSWSEQQDDLKLQSNFEVFCQKSRTIMGYAFPKFLQSLNISQLFLLGSRISEKVIFAKDFLPSLLTECFDQQAVQSISFTLNFIKDAIFDRISRSLCEISAETVEKSVNDIMVEFANDLKHVLKESEQMNALVFSQFPHREHKSVPLNSIFSDFAQTIRIFLRDQVVDLFKRISSTEIELSPEQLFAFFQSHHSIIVDAIIVDRAVFISRIAFAISHLVATFPVFCNHFDTAAGSWSEISRIGLIIWAYSKVSSNSLVLEVHPFDGIHFDADEGISFGFSHLSVLLFKLENELHAFSRHFDAAIMHEILQMFGNSVMHKLEDFFNDVQIKIVDSKQKESLLLALVVNVHWVVSLLPCEKNDVASFLSHIQSQIDPINWTAYLPNLALALANRKHRTKLLFRALIEWRGAVTRKDWMLDDVDPVLKEHFKIPTSFPRLNALPLTLCPTMQTVVEEKTAPRMELRPSHDRQSSNSFFSIASSFFGQF